MRRIELAGFIVVASIVAVAAAPVLDPALGVIFPAEHARDLLRQCSRGVPQSVQGTWTPDVSQISRLEKAFPRAFSQAVANRNFDRSERLIGQMDQYARQYGGIVIEKRKLIYVNGFLAPWIEMGAKSPIDDHWQHQAEMVCDGGPAFFGAEFDPATDTFEHFAFNGVA